MNKIDFNHFKSLFPEDQWDIGYFSPDSFMKVLNFPIKFPQNLFGRPLTDLVNNGFDNGIILFRKTDPEMVADYSFYEESEKIIENGISSPFVGVYLNFKEAAIISGLAKRAKNSLVYNRKFGFQCKIFCYMFQEEIVNYEVHEEDRTLLDLCEGCNDCIKNCPVNAIHETWIDAQKCYDFLGFGNHPTIPSAKWFWYEKMRPNIPREVVESWTTWGTTPKLEWGQGIDGFYESDSEGNLYKDGKLQSRPICNECQQQPKCSKAPIDNQQIF